VGPATVLVEPVCVEGGAVVGQHCEIGPGVFLESGCAVGDRAVVRRSVVLRGARVDPGEVIEDRVVV
jgi:NDP-sugar pyrophosphorylase family protein